MVNPMKANIFAVLFSYTTVGRVADATFDGLILNLSSRRSVPDLTYLLSDSPWFGRGVFPFALTSSL